MKTLDKITIKIFGVFTHRVGSDRDRLVTVAGWWETVHQIGQSWADGCIVFRAHNNKSGKI